MEIEADKFKKIIIELFRNLQSLETEILAYRFMIDLATKSGLSDPQVPWDKALEGARQNPVLVKVLADKYDPLVANFLRAVDQAVSDQELAELLRSWKPTGEPN